MKSRWQLSTSLIVGAAMMMSAISVAGQQKPEVGSKVVIERSVQGPDDPQGPPLPGSMWVFMASEMNFDGKLVKGAPYSAQGVTETTQTLSDGNRIVNKSTSAVYRDSEGRTRRENTLQAIGPFANSGEPAQTISINDPVAGVNFALDPRTHVAHKMTPMRFEFKIAGPSGGEVHAGAPAEAPAAGVRIERSEVESQVFMRSATAPRATGGGAGMVMEYHVSGEGKAKASKTESLDKQSIEGVDAEGTRTTITIPAGEMGNERPIEIVSERWYSPELQVVVMTKHSDPRFGETSYRLTNIDRSEPAKSLFEVPADYTIQATPGRAIGGFDSGAGDNSGPKAINGGVLNGKAVSLPMPAYPDVARQAGAFGTVTVAITMDEDGNVISAHATSGHPLLQAAAVDAARKAKFAPTRLSGQPVKVQGVVTYTFAPAHKPANEQ